MIGMLLPHNIQQRKKAAATPLIVPSYETRCNKAKQFGLLPPEQRKRSPLFVPRSIKDFDDGGSFPEIHVAQYPRNMGNPHLSRTKPTTTQKGGSATTGTITSSSTAIVNVEVDAKGEINYDAILTGGTNADKKVYTSHHDLKGTLNPSPDDIALPSKQEEQSTTQRTAAALNALVSSKIADANPTGSAMIQASTSKNQADKTHIAWKIRLVNEQTGDALPITSSGGLPRSKDTWSSGMTFCADREDLESIGRAADWGCSTWFASNVCDALGHLSAEVDMTLFDQRSEESSLAWPPLSRGAIGAARKATMDAAQPGDRTFRVGEVIVPMNTNDEHVKNAQDASFIIPGMDYRIMTMTDKNGNEIFSTKSLPSEERKYAQLAVRPCGYKTQNQLWQKRGILQNEWPVNVQAGLLAPSALTRFNPATALPRITSAFARDTATLLLAVALAIAPIPLSLVGRNFVSLYAIPSASMDPTLRKGDVLLVEKLPGVLDRTERGDVVLFSPPPTLRDIIGSNSKISGTSLFVKRVVGLPGDKDIVMDPNTNEVDIGGNRASGPDRNMCDDEPLRLIDRLLENGKGKYLEALGEDDVYVLGDCKAVSVDSRVFGPLPKENVVGRPLARIWPLSRLTVAPL